MPLAAEFLDAEFDHVADVQIAWRLHPHADSRRGAGRDDIAGFEDDEAADVAHQGGAIEYHRRRVPGLHSLAIDVQPHLQILDIANLIARDEPRPDRAEGFAALALVPS